MEEYCSRFGFGTYGQRPAGTDPRGHFHQRRGKGFPVYAPIGADPVPPDDFPDRRVRISAEPARPVSGIQNYKNGSGNPERKGFIQTDRPGQRERRNLHAGPYL